jgi:hypothetical protein
VVGGYPLAFTIKTADVALTWPDGMGFTARSLKVRARPWALRRFRVSAAGGFGVSFPFASTSPALARLSVTLAGETLRGTASFADSAWPTAIDLTADSVTISRGDTEGAAGRELASSTVTLTGSRPATPPKADTDIALDLDLQMLDLSAPLIEDNPLGSTIARADLHLQVLGAPPATPDAAGLKAWRDAGGTLNMPNISLQWGQLGLTANGTAAFDADMQPEGAFTANLTGFDQTIDALAAAGWIKQSAAGFARLGLGLAARVGPDGKPLVTTPITIQNRRVSLGPIKLGQVPEIHLE